MTTLAVDETWNRLGAVAQLLHTAALKVWTRAEQQAPDSPLHALGLGVYLVQTQTTALLPDDYDIPDSDVDELDRHDALELLTAAEELTRPLPMHRADMVGVCDLVVDLCALIREARRLGC